MQAGIEARHSKFAGLSSAEWAMLYEIILTTLLCLAKEINMKACWDFPDGNSQGCWCEGSYGCINVYLSRVYIHVDVGKPGWQSITDKYFITVACGASQRWHSVYVGRFVAKCLQSDWRSDAGLSITDCAAGMFEDFCIRFNLEILGGFDPVQF